MGGNHGPSRLNAPPWLPWVLGLALITIVGSHLVAWVNSLVVSQALRTQQRLLSDLVQYQSLLSDLDESLRAVMLAPERADLKRQKADAILALQEHLGALAEEAPISGSIPKDLISLATHFRKKLVPQADLVQKHAAAPGPWAMERFRKDYAEVRFHHAEQVQALIEATRGLGEASVSTGLHRLMVSAGISILLWSGFLTWLVLRVRLRGVAGLPAVLTETETAAAAAPSHHAAPASEHAPASAAEIVAHPAGHPGGAVVSAAAPVAAVVPVPEPTSSASSHPEDHSPAVDPTTPPVRPADPPATAAPPAPSPAAAAAVTPAAASVSDAGGGELGQSEIADLLRETGTADPGAPAAASPPVATGSAAETAAPPVNSPSVAPSGAAKEAHQPPAPTPAPAPQSAPAVLPAGPVDLSALLQEDVPPAAPPSPPPPPAPAPSEVALASGVPASAPAAPAAASAAPAPAVAVASTSPTPALATPKAPVAPAAPAPSAPPEPVAAVAPEPEAAPPPPAPPPPLPDVQTLMKGASAMTTEQLTAMLFGSPAPAAAKPAAPAAPPPAPAAPPRTITGSEMATTKPGEEASGVVDLSF